MSGSNAHLPRPHNRVEGFWCHLYTQGGLSRHVGWAADKETLSGCICMPPECSPVGHQTGAVMGAAVSVYLNAKGYVTFKPHMPNRNIRFVLGL
jgi:hypothetical protein